MIKIEERICEKLSGVTSLFLSFDYNEKIISWIKQTFELYVYNKKTHEWELPINCLAQILDNLSAFDDLNVNLYKEQEHLLKRNITSFNYKLKPFKHQEEAILFGVNREKFLLLDDMGLGKTASIIHIAEELKKDGLQHCLIVCGLATLRGNWKKEIGLHSYESCRIIGERVGRNGNSHYATIGERIAELTKPIDEFFLVVNIETLRSDDFINAIKLGPNKIDMIVVDEVHRCSNRGSLQGSNLLKLKARYQIAATGTLLTNSPLTAYLPLSWIGADHATLTNYKRQYCKFGGFGGHEVIGYKNLDILKEEIDHNSLRRTKEEVLKDLPEKTIIKEIVTLSDEHRKFYNDVKKGVKEEVDKINLNTSNLLSLVTRLRQATACPSILTTKDIKSSKIERCVDLTEDLVSRGEKVVIFSTFKESVKYIAEALKAYKPLICTGDSKDSEINENVDIFQNDPSRKVFIATHQKMGTGVTLTAASYMIFMDTPFTSASFQQACDRIYRIGTKRNVFIYNLICEGTIDERVAKIVDTKQALSDYVIDDKLTEKNIEILRDYILDL